VVITDVRMQSANAVADIYLRIIFPEMKVTWEVHPNNLGHNDFPECFRCHDGSHTELRRSDDLQRLLRMPQPAGGTVGKPQGPDRSWRAIELHRDELVGTSENIAFMVPEYIKRVRCKLTLDYQNNAGI
jgi:hypothetical protein